MLRGALKSLHILDHKTFAKMPNIQYISVLVDLARSKRYDASYRRLSRSSEAFVIRCF
jgi:hypothetical protein